MCVPPVWISTILGTEIAAATRITIGDVCTLHVALKCALMREV